MAAILRKPLTRMVAVDGDWYRVVLSEDGIRCTLKGRRRGWFFPWADLLAQPDEETHSTDHRDPGTASTEKLGMPAVVAADVLLLMRRASETLTDASGLITNASELPAALVSHRESREPTERERSDWFIEPLLTLRQVSELLNVSTHRVRALGLTPINLDGQIRFHPADVRRFIAFESGPGSIGKARPALLRDGPENSHPTALRLRRAFAHSVHAPNPIFGKRLRVVGIEGG